MDFRLLTKVLGLVVSCAILFADKAHAAPSEERIIICKPLDTPLQRIRKSFKLSSLYHEDDDDSHQTDKPTVGPYIPGGELIFKEAPNVDSWYRAPSTNEKWPANKLSFKRSRRDEDTRRRQADWLLSSLLGAPVYN